MVLMDFIVKNDLLGAITGLKGMVYGKKIHQIKINRGNAKILRGFVIYYCDISFL